MSGTLQELVVFRLNLKKRKVSFDKHRVSNKKDKAVKLNSPDSTKKVSKSTSVSKEATAKNEDLVSSVKSYTEKIKAGFFGKKSRRI